MFFENLKLNTSEDFLDNNSVEITLTFIGDTLDKNETSNLLHITPTHAWNANEIMEIGSSKRIRIPDVGKWSLKSISKAEDLNHSLDVFFKNLPDDSEIWNKLTSKYETFVEITGYQNSWNHSYAISSKTLLELTKRNLSLNFDIYNVNMDDITV